MVAGIQNGVLVIHEDVTRGHPLQVPLRTSAEVRQVLLQHSARLRVCLQQVSGDGHGPEEGSDAWLLLNALIDNDEDTSDDVKRRSPDDTLPSLLALLENSGRCLAEQGGKLEVRLQGLQRYTEATAVRLHASPYPRLSRSCGSYLHRTAANGPSP